MRHPLTEGPRDHATTYLDGERRILFRNLGDPERNRDLDIEGWVRYARTLGATTVCIDIKTNYGAHWDTQRIPRDPYGAHRDLGAELARAAKKYGLKYVFYFPIANIDSLAAEHPDWQARTARGAFEAESWKTGSVFCLNTGYRELLGELLSDIITRYRPHGFYFDGYLPGFAACFCAACKRKYRRETGRRMPLRPAWDDPAWHAFLRWREADHAQSARFLHEVIHGLDPQIAIIWNAAQIWFGWYGAQSPAKAQWLDFACAEDALGVMRNPIRLKQFPAFTHGDMLAWSIGVTRAFQNGRTANHYNYFQPSTRLPEALCATRLVTAAGAQAAIQEGFRHMKPVFETVREMEPWLIGAHPAGDVALHYSQSTHRAYCRPAGLAEDVAFYHETGGAFTGLTSNHALTEFLTDEGLEQADLSAFRLVVLPNSVSLSDRAAARLRAYVRAGGALLAGFETNLRDDAGQRKTDELLWSGSGLHFVDTIETLALRLISPACPQPFEVDRPVPPDQFLRFESYRDQKVWLGEDLRLGRRPDGVQRTCALQFDDLPSCHFPARSIEIRAGRSWQPLFVLRFRRDRETGWEECPAAVTRPFGRGRITYVNSLLGTLIATRYHAWWRNLWDRLVTVTAGPAPVRIRAPGCIKAFLWRQPDHHRQVLVLINDLSSSGLRELQREDCVPVAVEADLQLPGVRSVKAVLGGGPACRIEKSGRTWRVRHAGVAERLVLACEQDPHAGSDPSSSFAETAEPQNTQPQNVENRPSRIPTFEILKS